MALFVIASQVPGHLSRIHHDIDYTGIVLLSLGVTALVLLTSLGGTTYAWNSTPIYLFAIGGAILLFFFAIVERRAKEPVLPLHLFRIRTFTVASIVGFIVALRCLAPSRSSPSSSRSSRVRIPRIQDFDYSP